jgi:hypothetical protein
MKRTMHTARILAKSSRGHFQSDTSARTVANHDNRMAPSVFTVTSSDVRPPRRIMNAFYDSLKPFIIVMRAMGVCPLCVNNKGNDIFSNPATRSKVMELKCSFCVKSEKNDCHFYGQLSLT